MAKFTRATSLRANAVKAAASQAAQIATHATNSLTGDEQEAAYRLAAVAVTFPLSDDPSVPPSWAEAASWWA